MIWFPWLGLAVIKQPQNAFTMAEKGAKRA
jgi:hypothetical protein